MKRRSALPCIAPRARFVLCAFGLAGVLGAAASSAAARAQLQSNTPIAAARAATPQQQGDTPPDPAATPQAQSAPEADAAARFAALALKCLHQEYPNHLNHTLSGPADARAPHELTPAFYGCLDWHSDVHGHWLLVRLLRLFPQAPYAAQAREQLARSFTPENIARELSYLRGAGRVSFERPYGLAWLLQLTAELRQWDDRDARSWSATLAPLESEVATRLANYLPRLYYPIRIGEHDQTAFALGLVWDWAGVSGDEDMQALLRDAAQRFYLHDRACPLAYEPSGEDFLSPCLAEADYMRRVLAPPVFARWLSDFLPQIPGTSRSARGNANRSARTGSAGAARAQVRGGAGESAARPWIEPGIVTDRADPKLAHIDGLNLSRAWMLQGIARGLPSQDARVPALLAAAAAHAQAALPAVTGEHYEGGHWLGTFAVYLTSQAGLAR